MSKKLVLLLTIMLLSFAPMSVYADDSILIMKNLVFQLDQQKIVTDIFSGTSTLASNQLQNFMKGDNNQYNVEESLSFLRDRTNQIKDPKTYAAMNSGVSEIERAYSIAKAYRQYPTNKGINDFYNALSNGHAIFYDQAMKANALYFQIYNNIMNF